MRRSLLGAMTAVLVLAGCSGPGDPGDRGGDRGSRPTSAASAATDLGPVVECPAPVPVADPNLPDEVPSGATSVRLCDGGAERVSPPVDALATDVAAVVDAVNGQRLVSRRCADLQTPTYRLAFGYPDGSRFVVAGRFTGCGELLVGSGRRAKAGPPLRAFVDGLRAQRATTAPPDLGIAPDDLDCARPARTSTPVARPTDLTVAVLCFGRRDRPEEAHRLAVPPDDLTILTRSMGVDTASSAGYLGCGAVARNEPWIVGSSAWGDPITMTRGCFALTVEDDLEWTPRGQAHAILRRLLAAVR